MTNAKHTQTPWRTDTNGDIRDFDNNILLFKNYSGHGLTNAKEQMANALLVIKTVNCHDELLEAARVALMELGGYVPRRESTQQAMNQLNAAILKAEGK